MSAHIRVAGLDDLAFVADAMRRSLQGRHPWDAVEQRTWDIEMHKRIERLLERSTVVVACDPDEPSVVWAFAVVEQSERILHYVYTKFPLRMFGLARELIQSVWSDAGREPITATSLPDNCHIERMHKYRINYNPFLGWMKEREDGGETNQAGAA